LVGVHRNTIEKLDESGERQRIARRHAEYYRNFFARAETEALARPPGEWLAEYAREIGNLRAALDWALSPGADLSIGVAPTSAAVTLATHARPLESENRGEPALHAVVLSFGNLRNGARASTLRKVFGATSLARQRGRLDQVRSE